MSGMSKAKSSVALKFTVGAGATTATTNTVTGLTTEDTVIYILSRVAATGVPTDRTATSTVVAGGFTSSVTLTGLTWEILWLDNSL